jgi:hypothetical protein
MSLLFVIAGPHKTNASDSDRFLFCLHFPEHGRPSNYPAPWRRGVVLLPLRGPPEFRFPHKKPVSPKFTFFGSSRKM